MLPQREREQDVPAGLTQQHVRLRWRDERASGREEGARVLGRTPPHVRARHSMAGGVQCAARPASAASHVGVALQVRMAHHSSGYGYSGAANGGGPRQRNCQRTVVPNQQRSHPTEVATDLHHNVEAFRREKLHRSVERRHFKQPRRRGAQHSRADQPT